jgi:hypothetical protein
MSALFFLELEAGQRFMYMDEDVAEDGSMGPPETIPSVGSLPKPPA